MVYIAICDDVVDEIGRIVSVLEIWRNSHPEAQLRYRTFLNPLDLIESSEKEKFDLYLLDVVMPGINGISVAKELRATDGTARIVFLTSSPEFAYESYSVKATDYILKPVNQERLIPFLDELYFAEQSSCPSMILKKGATIVRVPVSLIEYVEINGKHLYFYLADGSFHEIFGSMNEYRDLLISFESFMQVHRSYIVNMLRISELSPSGAVTNSGRTVPVSRSFYPQLRKNYIELIFDRKKR